MQRLSQKELVDFVDTHAVHFRSLDLDGFRAWLSQRIEESLPAAVLCAAVSHPGDRADPSPAIT